MTPDEIGRLAAKTNLTITRPFAIFVEPCLEDNSTWLAKIVGHGLDNSTFGDNPLDALDAAQELLELLTGVCPNNANGQHEYTIDCVFDNDEKTPAFGCKHCDSKISKSEVWADANEPVELVTSTSKPKQKFYVQANDASWNVAEYEPQCDAEFIIGPNRCQGVMNHKGEHWAYDASGYYHYADNKNDVDSKRNKGSVAGTIPAGHKDYISPVDMVEKHHSAFRTVGPVTDPDVIAKLNNGDELDENSTVSRLCSDEAVEELRKSGRLDGLENSNYEESGLPKLPEGALTWVTKNRALLEVRYAGKYIAFEPTYGSDDAYNGVAYSANTLGELRLKGDLTKYYLYYVMNPLKL